MNKAQAFSYLGLDPSLAGSVSAASSLSQAVDQFASSQIGQAAAGQLSNVLGTVLPPILRTAPVSGGIRFTPAAREWESIHYANDLIAHQPKYKFLFKVKFKNFPGGEFEYFVHRCDRPKVQLNHADVNYYNFRSKVLTSVTFSPLSMTFLDETGDTVNRFFREYLKKLSYQASGGFGIDKGNSTASSSRPYEKGHSIGGEIIIQQIFANGLADNQFIFKNPRIETFDFDELSMEDTNGTMMNLSFHYDALVCVTGGGGPINHWGNTDIGAGGGTSNFSNAGSDVAGPVSSFGSGGSPRAGKSPVTYGRTDDVSDGGSDEDSPVLSAISDLIGGLDIVASTNNIVSSALSTLDRGVQDTFDSVLSGDNFKFSAGTVDEFTNNVTNQAVSSISSGINSLFS